MKVRIGIDVGGTFTDAVAIDDDSYDVIGMVKTPTTHAVKEGVAKGIVDALHKLMGEHSIRPEDVVFIAHGTTQSTNALLEGDVADVGVVTLGNGLQGAKSKSDTSIPPIELAPGKFLRSFNEYVSTADPAAVGAGVDAALSRLARDGAAAIVAAEAFSVDDPTYESLAVELCGARGLPATATNEVSKLYGLKIRTRTAVINASIMPKMLEAATMTDWSIKEAGIASPLMVMRCDGGVMTVEEVRRRPIMTILSGPAAGVAGALMYEKLTDGLFFEVGGTSTDISCVKDGKVIIKYAEVGGHKTYLNSLDVHTVGIGGGSMVAMRDGKAVDAGPRSAHIAGLDYEVYADPAGIVDPRLVAVRPKPSDPEYACVECRGGLRLALTLSGAANIAGYVRREDYAYADPAAARKAWQPLADSMGCSVEAAAEKVLAFAAAKNAKVARELMSAYGMDPAQTVLVGGGGGAAAAVPYLAETLGQKFRIAHNAPVISTIGVALAMVREMVERTVASPTDEDVVSIRKEAEAKALVNGAAAGTVEVTIEIDGQRNLLRAIAVGATEMRSKTLGERRSRDELLAIVSENLGLPATALEIAAGNGSMLAVQGQVQAKGFLGLRKKRTPLRLIDDEGVIRLQKGNAQAEQVAAAAWEPTLQKYLDLLTEFNDGGESIPMIYLVVGKRIVDLSGVIDRSQVLSLAQVELAGRPADETIIVVASRRDQG